MARNAYEVELGDGRMVVLRELKSREMVDVMAAGDKHGKVSGEMAISFEGLRYSIVKIDGKDINYAMLAGDFLDEEFSIAEMMILQRAWQAIHLPDAEEAEGIKGKLKAVAQ